MLLDHTFVETYVPPNTFLPPMGIKASERMIVIWLQPGGQAAVQGVQIGWKVVAVNGVVIGDSAEFTEALSTAQHQILLKTRPDYEVTFEVPPADNIRQDDPPVTNPHFLPLKGVGEFLNEHELRATQNIAATLATRVRECLCERAHVRVVHTVTFLPPANSPIPQFPSPRLDGTTCLTHDAPLASHTTHHSPDHSPSRYSSSSGA